MFELETSNDPWLYFQTSLTNAYTSYNRFSPFGGGSFGVGNWIEFYLSIDLGTKSVYIAAGSAKATDYMQFTLTSVPTTLFNANTKFYLCSDGTNSVSCTVSNFALKYSYDTNGLYQLGNGARNFL